MDQTKDNVVLAHRPSRFPSVFLVTKGSILSPVLVVIAAAFIAFGSIAWKESATISSIKVTYSDVNKYQYVPSDAAVNINMGIRNFTVGTTTHRQGSKVRFNFTVTTTLNPPIYFYYTMTNFYQSISFFHDGRSSEQLAGLPPSSSFLYRCEPFRKPGFLNDRLGTAVTLAGGKQLSYNDFLYYPCGSAAWSMFNDSFTIFKLSSSSYVAPSNPQVELDATKVSLICNGSDFDATGEPRGGSTSANACSKKGISRPQDVKIRFQPINFAENSWSSRYPFNASDPFLAQGWYADEPGHSIPDPMDLDFQVWMATAPTSNFRKLHRIIETPLIPGVYIVEVDEYFDSVSYRGTKGIEIRTAQSWLIDSNYPLAGCYIGMGIAAFLAATVIGIKSFLAGRRDAKELAAQRRREEAGGEASAIADSALSHLNFSEEGDAASRKRWYTFDIHSDEMRRYVELRREREDIRKWQLSNMNDNSDDDEEFGVEDVEDDQELVEVTNLNGGTIDSNNSTIPGASSTMQNHEDGNSTKEASK